VRKGTGLKMLLVRGVVASLRVSGVQDWEIVQSPLVSWEEEMVWLRVNGGSLGPQDPRLHP